MLKNCFLIFLLVVFTNLSFGQNLQKLQVWQDSLSKLEQVILSNISEVERIESNFLFVKTLVSSLKETNSYYFNFEQLNMISCLRSPDDKFRIFSWNVPLQDGSYLYYGSVQLQSGSLKLVPLLDKTFEIEAVDKVVLEPKMWYGVQYYEIIPFNSNQYLLLGWKGHDAHTTKKVIELLTILPDKTMRFGADIFADDPSMQRKVFTYAKKASMLLKYNKENRSIEFDHLVPLEGGSKDQNIPDLTHDAYLIGDKKLHLKKDILVVNKEN